MEINANVQQVLWAFFLGVDAAVVIVAIARLGGARPNWGAACGIAVGIPLAVAIQVGTGLAPKWHPLSYGVAVGLCGLLFSAVTRGRRGGA